MSLLDQRDSVVVGRLRVKGTSGDHHAEQRRAFGLLRNADLRSRHVPAGGLLCVRTLRDPAPRLQPLGTDRVYLLPAWELAVNRQLDRHATEAVRPVRGHIASSAESVLFLDEGEVLACLAADWLGGTLSRNWWWRQVLKSFDCGAVIEKWMRSPAAVPAAMELLHSWDMDERFVAQIPDAHAEPMLREVLRVHGVPRVDERPSTEAAEAIADSRRRERARSLRGPSRDLEEREPPWASFVSLRGLSELSGSGQQLLTQAHMLRRAPDVARSLEFQRELSAYFADHVSQRRTHEYESEATENEAGSLDIQLDRPPTELREGKDPLSARQRESRKPAFGRVDHARPTSGEESGEVPTVGGDTVPQDFSGGDTGKASAGKDTNTGKAEGDGRGETSAAETANSEAPIEQTPAVDLQRIRTSFGGLFFLLNVSVALGFYADFFAPAAEPLDVNLWDFLAIFGERFTCGELRNDALWPLLAELAGRDEEEIPGSQNPWLLAPSEQWIDEVANRIASFLRDALNRDDAVELLCRQSASITSTPTHIDVHFSMEAHPIEVRIACLDRDPGWIPAGGRYVAYHFD